MTGAYVPHVERRTDSVCRDIDLLAIAAGGQSAAGTPLTVAGGAVTLSWTDAGVRVSCPRPVAVLSG